MSGAHLPGQDPDALRAFWRSEVSSKDGMDRYPFAFGGLASAVQSQHWSPEQLTAIAEGLELGMREGIR